MFEKLNVDLRCKKEIEKAIDTGRLSHAIILEGADEVTRYEAAKEIATALVCENSEKKPCGVCKNCKKAKNDCHPDIHFLKKEDGAATIKVDEIRELKKKAQLVPNDAKCSVFIILQAQELGIQAQNALLKIFEEPSSDVKIILCCNSKSSFLDTIISRSTTYCLLQTDDGNQGDGEKNERAASLSQSLIDCLCGKDEFSFLALTAEFGKDRELFVQTMKGMIMILRDAAVALGGSDIMLSPYEQTVHNLTVLFTQEKLLSYISICGKLIDSVNQNANINLVSTILCSSFYEIKLK